ncbi:MAG: hypothetical protein WC213_00165 [Arenimonas sp.]|jgi:hypothetical protein
MPDAKTDARETLIHTICPHIKQWCDETDMPTICEKCPATVKTSQGEGVQMCRLNAEKAADAILAAQRYDVQTGYAVGLSEALSKGFMTARAYVDYQIIISFDALEDMQAAHTLLCTLSSADRSRPKVIGRVTGKEYDGDQVAGMPGAICHACGLKDYPCVNPDCPNRTTHSSTHRGGQS